MLKNDDNLQLKEQNNFYPSFQHLQRLLSIKDSDDAKQHEQQQKESDYNLQALHAEQLQVLQLQKQLQEMKEEKKNVTNDEMFHAEHQQVLKLQKQLQHLNEEMIHLRSVNNNPSNIAISSSNGLPSPSSESPIGLPPPPPSTSTSTSVGLPSPITSNVSNDELGKYRRMLKMGIPVTAIANKMRQSGIDSSVISEFENSGQFPSSSSSALPTTVVVVVDDGLNKFRKMLKMRVPRTAVASKMRQAGISKSIIEQFENTGELPGGTSTSVPASLPTNSSSGLTKEESLKLAKYLKMKKMGIPKQAIMNKMTQGGIDEELQNKLYADDSSLVTHSTSNTNNNNTTMVKKIVKAKTVRPPIPLHLKPKREIKPKRKMRNLQWQKIDPYEYESSIWKSCDDNKVKFNIHQLELFFGSDVKSKKNQNSNNRTSKKKKMNADVVHVLDGKRSYNVEIFLARMRMKPEVITDAILTLNERVFSFEQVSKLEKFVPTPNEYNLFVGLEHEKNLGKAEAFFNIVMKVDKNLPQRISLWAFKLSFVDQLQIEHQKVELLMNAHMCIQTSQSLKEIFSIILAFGNYMNGGTRKGKAYGFKLSSLQQLTRSRSIDNKMTLMEYLYVHLQTNRPQLLSFVDEWKMLDNATTIDVQTMKGNINKMNSKLNMIRKRIEQPSDNICKGDCFSKVMKPFLKNAMKTYEHTKQMSTKLTADLKAQAFSSVYIYIHFSCIVCLY